jgi:MFS-type transporter involved in bile tolerance (Atg22 family)
VVLPKGQEAELSGFFVYCTQILTFLPPLIFTVMIESGINMKWGLMSMIIFFVIAIGFLCLVSPWEEVLKESAKVIDAVQVEDVTGETLDAEEP